MRHKTTIVLSAVLLAAALMAAGWMLPPRFTTGGYNDPDSDSSRVADILSTQFHARPFDLALLVTVSGGVDEADTVTSARQLVEELSQQPQVTQVVSYWSGVPSLKSRDSRSALILASVEAGRKPEAEVLHGLADRYQGQTWRGLRLAVTGPGVVANAISDTILADLTKTEIIVLPLTLVLLFLVFGSLVSALMPLVIGVTSIAVTSALLALLSRVADVSVFSLNLTTGLGLGLGIDYALLLVSRFREERAKGLSPEESATVMLATAGRTVLFSGLTVAMTLGALLMFPLVFLKSLAFAGILVVATALLSALVLLPPLLVLAGKHLETGALRKVRSGAPGFGRLAGFVTKFPIPLAAVALTALVLLALPAGGLNLGMIDERALPAGTAAAQASRQIADSLDGRETAPIEILLPKTVTAEALADLQGRIAALANVLSVRELPGQGDWLRAQAVPRVEPRTPESARLIGAIREAVKDAAPHGLVGGAGADYADSLRTLAEHAPAAALWVALAMFLLFFLFTGSVVLPLKALLLNALSLSATLGVLTWIFVGGQTWLVGGFTAVGSIDASILVLTVVVVFALSMDYEVFLLLRIKEEFLASGDLSGAVAAGLRRSGFIITVAAALLAIVFVGFVFSGVTTIKVLGAGVTVALLLDATVVRIVLMPAVMILARRWNWWAPAPMRLWYERFGFHE